MKTRIFIPTSWDITWNKDLDRRNDCKNLETSLSWRRVDPQSNGKCPYQRQKGEDVQRHMREGHVKIPVKTKAEVGVMGL